jgi:hypothetical protein
VVAIVLAVVAAYGQEFLRSLLDTVGKPASQWAEQMGEPDAIAVVDVRMVSSGQMFVHPEGSRTTTEVEVTKSGFADQVKWEITLEGRRSRTVEVVDIVPVIEGGQCGPPVIGVLYAYPMGAGSAEEKIWLGVEVDKRDPKFIGDGSRPYFDTKKISLPKGEKNNIVVSASTSGPHCRWTIRMDYLADGKPNHLTVTAPDGQPFELVGFVSPLSQYPGPVYCNEGRDRFRLMSKTELSDEGHICE